MTHLVRRLPLCCMSNSPLRSGNWLVTLIRQLAGYTLRLGNWLVTPRIMSMQLGCSRLSLA